MCFYFDFLYLLNNGVPSQLLIRYHLTFCPFNVLFLFFSCHIGCFLQFLPIMTIITICNGAISLNHIIFFFNEMVMLHRWQAGLSVSWVSLFMLTRWQEATPVATNVNCQRPLHSLAILPLYFWFALFFICNVH